MHAPAGPWAPGPAGRQQPQHDSCPPACLTRLVHAVARAHVPEPKQPQAQRAGVSRESRAGEGPQGHSSSPPTPPCGLRSLASLVNRTRPGVPHSRPPHCPGVSAPRHPLHAPHNPCPHEALGSCFYYSGQYFFNPKDLRGKDLSLSEINYKCIFKE